MLSLSVFAIIYFEPKLFYLQKLLIAFKTPHTLTNHWKAYRFCKKI